MNSNTTRLMAAILDMDGVVTQTAKVHARAWKQMFDAFLETRRDGSGQPQRPFDIDHDYRRYVDGKPRYDGVRSFLESRQIRLPYGTKEDGPDEETVCGLGNRKNKLFRQLLEHEGVGVYTDTVEQIGIWKRAGWRVAVISSSRNCEAVLRSANVFDLFDAKVDGDDMDRLDLPGKPAPDIFLVAAKALDAEPARTLVVEDAVAGIEAARQGGFGSVIGIARNRDATDLRDAGADLVVRDLRELGPMARSAGSRPSSAPHAPEHALSSGDWLGDRIKDRHLALFLDYDGTLTPIVRRPEEATLTDAMRTLLGRLAEHCTLAVVSGRDRKDVQQMVKLENLIYAGSHGFDIEGPGGLRLQQPAAVQALPVLNEAEAQLRGQVAAVTGARLERKRFALAVHFREVASDADVARLEHAVDEVRREYPTLRKRGGKKIFELQPDIPWDKGRAVLWLIEALKLDPARLLVVYIGDDVTDEDAFQAIRDHNLGVGIRVASSHSATKASRYVRDCGEVQQLLESLLTVLRTESTV